MSGRREKYEPRGGPDGGDGGDGGSVYLVGDAHETTLHSFRYKREYSAEGGGQGEGGLRHGRKGSSVEIRVPVGTQIWEVDSSQLLVDIVDGDQRICIARGGSGGRGNSRFKSSTNRFPLLAEDGERGERLSLRLELKLLADVGIIGAPNAGKSSLLSGVSAARPKIAAYPFTTLDPVVGVVERHEQRFVMVDIPGLIEGAHDGAGLGHDFLRHMERTRALVHVVDVSDDDVEAIYGQTNDELGLFNQELLEKPQIVALNKIDIPEAKERAHSLSSDLAGRGMDSFPISAATGEGLGPLLDRVVQMLSEAPPRAAALNPPEAEVVPVLRPKPRQSDVRVRRMRGAFVVTAPEAERMASVLDDSNWGARIQFYRHLRRIGVVKALERAGIKSGDTVRIERLEWEWE